MFLDAMYQSCPYPAMWVENQGYLSADIAVMWGMPKKAVPISWWREDILLKHETVVIMDSGYVKRGGGEENYQAVGLNGLNGRANFKKGKAVSGRWEDLDTELRPWRPAGEHILLVGQVPWDASVQDTDHKKWLRDTAFELRRHTQREIRFRPHPNAWKHLPPMTGTEYSRAPLEADFDNCHAVVTYNSNVGVDAIIAGIPVFSFDKGSMVREISLNDLRQIEEPIMPTRDKWAKELAFTQWTHQEMLEGQPWRHLFDA
jgi:hypothetical protein